ncbi:MULTISPECIES: hypothetical protein [Halomarina]|uniref:PIN domain-containing protein n=2 Tax=Halomarina TaxID=871740 RepID=A0A6B0GQ11_9EURY|nr:MULTISPECIES: hypothetical protein [Halomarina]MWG33738.1 hypothetical protein [Halomarina oriensis]
MFLVLDSNVWIYIATASEYPVEIYSEALGERLIFNEGILTGDYQTEVTPYVVEEITQGLHRSKRVDNRDVDGVLEELYAVMAHCKSIRAEFSPSDVRELSLHETRTEPSTVLLGKLLGIQPKDVPIFLQAYNNRFEKPHILTDDSDFAQVSPAEYGLSTISIEDVNLSWGSP